MNTFPRIALMYSNWLVREEEPPDWTEEAEEPVLLVAFEFPP